MFNPSKFNLSSPKSILALLLLEVNASMAESCVNNDNIRKIGALNNALIKIEWFRKAQTLETFIKVGIITFPLTLISDLLELPLLFANGMTPLGGALSIAKKIVEDKSIFVDSLFKFLIVV